MIRNGEILYTCEVLFGDSVLESGEFAVDDAVLVLVSVPFTLATEM